MTDKDNDETPPTVTDPKRPSAPSLDLIYKLWASCDQWPLDDALNLVFGKTPYLPGESHTADMPSEKSLQLNVVRELAYNCAGRSLHILRTTVRPDVLYVLPTEFMDWATARGFTVSGPLRAAVEEARSKIKTRNKSEARKLTAMQRHRQRCEGLAAYLWSLPEHKNMTITDMTLRKELTNIGCEGHEYTTETLRDWIKALAPNAKPGRPRKRHA